jgi:hypothetical protein
VAEQLVICEVTYCGHVATIPDDAWIIHKRCGTAGFDKRIAAPKIRQ